MQEKTILRIALISSISGVLLLLLFCNFLKIDLIDISDINEDRIDEKVRIQGEVKSLKEMQKVTMFDLEDDTGRIKVVVFTEEKLHLDDSVIIEGTVLDYKGELEVNVERIEYVH
ncbi:MAG: OB-fold nucleic acid binding domain-containing protein [archaeon]